MNKQTNFIIRFKELSLGKHLFDFEIDDSFFAQFENAVVQKGSLSVEVELEKLNNLLVLDVTIDGEVAVECDRCLDEFFMPLSFEGSLIVSFSGYDKGDDEGNEDSSVETMVLHPSDDKLELSQYLYDSIGISLPIQRIHPDDEDGNSTCNREMLERLGQLLVSE